MDFNTARGIPLCTRPRKRPGVERKTATQKQLFYCDYSRAATSCSKTTFLHTPVPWKPTSRCSETNRHLYFVSVWIRFNLSRGKVNQNIGYPPFVQLQYCTVSSVLVATN